jgi:hypothetical protein
VSGVESWLFEALPAAAALIAISDRVSQYTVSDASEQSSRSQSLRSRETWGWNERRALALLLGLVIYVGLAYLASHATDEKLVGPVYLTSLAQASAVAIGVLFGPVVGCSVGVVGYVLTAVITTPHSGTGAGYYPFPPAFSVSDGLAGLTAGIAGALVVTTRQASWRTVALVAGSVVVGVVAGDLLAYHFLKVEHIAPSQAVFTTGLKSDVIAGVVVASAATWLGAEVMVGSRPQDASRQT